MIKLLILFFSLNTMAMVPRMVENADKLYENQKTPVWCWAATSSSLYNYYHDVKKTQESIVLNNPNSLRADKVEPYSIINIYDDYLLHHVLNSNQYQSVFKPFKTKETKQLIDLNHPVIVQQNFHVRIIVGYYEFQGITSFIVFDPASYLSFEPSVYLVPENSLESNVFGSMAMMLFLESKNKMISHIQPNKSNSFK